MDLEKKLIKEYNIYNKYIPFIFNIDKKNKYYIIKYISNNLDKYVIINANTRQDSLNILRISNKNIIVNQIIEIPLEYSIKYDTKKIKLLNIYYKYKNEFKIYKTIIHKVLIGQTDDLILHYYSRIYKNYYVQINNKNMTEKDRKHLIIDLTKKLRANTKISMQLCKEAASKVVDETEDENQNNLYKKAYNILIEQSKGKVVKTSSLKYNYFIIKKSSTFSKSVLVKFGFVSNEARNIVEAEYGEVLDKIATLYRDTTIYKLKDTKVTEKYLFTVKDLLNITYNVGYTVQSKLKEIIQVLNEKFEIINAEKIETIEGTQFLTYIHHNHNISSTINYMVDYKKLEDNNKNHKDFITKLNHVLVLNKPLCLHKNDLLKSIVSYEKNMIIKNVEKEINSIEDGNKKQKLIDYKDNKIEGLLNKFIKTAVFEEQKYPFDDEFKPEKGESDLIKDMLKKRHITIIDYILV